ncbi:MAG: hypothetical protein R3E13_03920 [Alphaproteobacteria bacterium]
MSPHFMRLRQKLQGGSIHLVVRPDWTTAAAYFFLQYDLPGLQIINPFFKRFGDQRRIRIDNSV